MKTTREILTRLAAVVCCFFVMTGSAYASEAPRPEASDDVRVYDLADILDDSRERNLRGRSENTGNSIGWTWWW